MEDDQYRNAYQSEEFREWLDSLDPDVRKYVQQHGLDKPMDARHGTLSGWQDVSELPIRDGLNPANIIEMKEVMEEVGDIVQERVDKEARRDVLAAFCARMRSVSNLALYFDAICFATGIMDVEGLSGTELARRHGVTKAAFSKICTQWVKMFDLPPSRGMKSARARKVYQNIQLTRSREHDD